MTPDSVGSRAGAFGKDLVAGATVGLVSLPQAMAFALVAGVPPEVALYTVIVPGQMARAHVGAPPEGDALRAVADGSAAWVI